MQSGGISTQMALVVFFFVTLKITLNLGI